MRKTISIAVMALLLSASGVVAQSKSGTSGPANPSASDRGLPQAPVGHRQPRASDVPPPQDKNYMESAEDRALDRKIKSICRGC